MVIIFTFLLGIGNFALHRAVLECYRPQLAQLPGIMARVGGRISLAAEFAVLLIALLLVANGHPGWGWAYLGYSVVNGAAAWMILSRRD